LSASTKHRRVSSSSFETKGLIRYFRQSKIKHPTRKSSEPQIRNIP
jgi:hypothetical protein